ncbi:MAG: DUF4388 domain-containing protein [Deltaproteobacteria bacterium]|nr:MAG: DUF4388 domain-containing protein [Deltaproteobacteria bacterium]
MAVIDGAMRQLTMDFALPCSPSYARRVALSGNLSETSFTDLIQFYSISRQTAAVTIVSPAGPEHDVVVFMEKGEIVDARFGHVTDPATSSCSRRWCPTTSRTARKKTPASPPRDRRKS